jgi:SHS2 domain-containing protein
MPFRYRGDIATADIAFAAWGDTVEELFAASALALLDTMVADVTDVESREELCVHVEEGELDLLLYGFLAELVYLKDARRLLLRCGELKIVESDGVLALDAVVCGERIDPSRHKLRVDVKAVTLHRLRVACEDGLWRATVVLDI